MTNSQPLWALFCQLNFTSFVLSPQDIASLERLIKDDVASSKTPLLVVANVGTPMAGHTDNLGRLRTICDDQQLWLHVNGWVFYSRWNVQVSHVYVGTYSVHSV